jgi:hypothetical protein
MAAADRELIGKKIGERYNLRRCVLLERCRDCSATRAAAKQPKTNGGVRLIPERRLGFQEKKV